MPNIVQGEKETKDYGTYILQHLPEQGSLMEQDNYIMRAFDVMKNQLLWEQRK